MPGNHYYGQKVTILNSKVIELISNTSCSFRSSTAGFAFVLERYPFRGDEQQTLVLHVHVVTNG